MLLQSSLGRLTGIHEGRGGSQQLIAVADLPGEKLLVHGRCLGDARRSQQDG